MPEEIPQTNRDLLRTEQRFKRLVEESPDTIIIVQIDNAHIMYRNDDALVGHPIVLEGHFLALVEAMTLPENRASILRQWQALVDPEQPDVPYSEWEVQRPDGGTEWLQSRAAVLRYEDSNMPEELLFTFSVITEQKLAEQALRDSEQQLRLLFDESLDIVVIIDVNERVLSVNAAIEDILGYTPQELLQQEFSMLLAEDSSLMESYHFNSLPFRRKNGSLCHMEITAQIVEWHQQECIYITLRDVSAREMLRREVEKNRQMQEELVRDREIMEARENMIFVVAHQLRNPLAVIHASASIVEVYHERLSSDRRQEHLNRIMSQARYLDRMTEMMLTAREALLGNLAYRPEPVSLPDLTRDVLETMDDRASEAHEFIFEDTTQTRIAMLDPTLLTYVIENLLSNALKYSPNGGDVHIQLSEDKNNYRIVVSDSGIGIPESARDRLFELFFRAENTQGYKGTGIGLGLAYSSVQAHGGTLTFMSEEGKGSTFIAQIPIVLPD